MTDRLTEVEWEIIGRALMDAQHEGHDMKVLLTKLLSLDNKKLVTLKMYVYDKKTDGTQFVKRL